MSLNRLAVSATAHCLAGCAIGEMLGMVLGSWFRLPPGITVTFAVILAFLFGYAFTLVPLLRSGVKFPIAARLALAADTVSIAVMEVVDNLVMLTIPGAMDASISSARFWVSLAIALLLAGVAAYPVNRWLLSRGRGHALVHSNHGSEAAPHFEGKRSADHKPARPSH